MINLYDHYMHWSVEYDVLTGMVIWLPRLIKYYYESHYDDFHHPMFYHEYVEYKNVVS